MPPGHEIMLRHPVKWLRNDARWSVLYLCQDCILYMPEKSWFLSVRLYHTPRRLKSTYMRQTDAPSLYRIKTLQLHRTRILPVLPLPGCISPTHNCLQDQPCCRQAGVMHRATPLPCLESLLADCLYRLSYQVAKVWWKLWRDGLLPSLYQCVPLYFGFLIRQAIQTSS